MFDFQILTPTDLGNADFSRSEYVLKKGELFGIPAKHYNNDNAMLDGCRLYIGNGKTPIKGLRYIGQDIDNGIITNSKLTGNMNCSEATINGGTFINSTIKSGNFLGFNVSTNDSNGQTQAFGTTSYGGVRFSGNSIYVLIAGNQTESLNMNDYPFRLLSTGSVFMSKGEVSNWGISEQKLYCGEENNTDNRNEWQCAGICSPEYSTSVPMSTIFAAGAKNHTQYANDSGNEGYPDLSNFVVNRNGTLMSNKSYLNNATAKLTANSDLKDVNSSNFPSYINTNVASANYLSNSVISVQNSPKEFSFSTGNFERQSIATFNFGSLLANCVYVFNLKISFDALDSATYCTVTIDPPATSTVYVFRVGNYVLHCCAEIDLYGNASVYLQRINEYANDSVILTGDVQQYGVMYTIKLIDQ